MSIEQNKAIIRRFFDEVVNKGDMEIAGKLMSQDFIDHSGSQDTRGLEGFKRFVAMVSGAFPDLNVTVEDLFAEGEKVVARVKVQGTHKGLLLGSIQPTGKHAIWTGTDIFRVKDGKIVGRWNERDLLGLMQQLGVIPSQSK